MITKLNINNNEIIIITKSTTTTTGPNEYPVAPSILDYPRFKGPGPMH